VLYVADPSRYGLPSIPTGNSASAEGPCRGPSNLASRADSTAQQHRDLSGRDDADAVLINDPEGIRHVLATNAANYVRPTMMPRVLRPLLGQGIFLAEGIEWRRQRRMLSPTFTPHNVGLLLPHFTGAANNLLRRLERGPTADLSAAFQVAALEAALRALFSMPDSNQRARLGAMVRGYIEGPGRPKHFGHAGTR